MISGEMLFTNIIFALYLEFITGGVELLWGKCTVFSVPVQGILTGGT
jgi:hypothetical protein